MKTNLKINRRDFLKSASMLSAAAPFILPSKVWGADTAPSNLLTMGFIGMGTQSRGLLGNFLAQQTRVLAVCDVDTTRRNDAKQKVDKRYGNQDCAAYNDFREIINRKDIDAVCIATPDHWHAKVSIDALAAGKHVYCEKPLTHTVEQALQVRDAVKRYKKVFQVGPNDTANDSYWKARQAIAAGRIGKPTWAHASYNRNARVCLFNEHQKIDPTAGPDKGGEDYINWDLWLGHQWRVAPKIPWTPEHFFRFRKFWPYNGGVATDLLYHKLAPLLIAMAGPNGEYPTRVNACGGLYIEKDGREIPDTFLLTADYPSEWSLFLVSTLTNDAGLPDRIYGKYGTMELGGEIKLRFNGDFEKEFLERNQGQEAARIPIEPRRDLEGNWLDAMRGTGPVHCNVDLGCATMVAIKMAVESYRQRKTLLWDARKEKVVTSESVG